jgi:hypothetical protein
MSSLVSDPLRQVSESPKFYYDPAEISVRSADPEGPAYGAQKRGSNHVDENRRKVL